MKKIPIATEVPDELLTQVGTIIARWSYVEWMLRQVAYKLLDLDPKRGRVAVREPRAEEFITMFRQILHIEGKPEPAVFKPLTNALRDAKTYRDRLAHGVWGKDPDSNELSIQYTGGNWRPNPSAPKISRRITPESMIVDLPTLEAINKLMGNAIDLTRECVSALIPPDEPAPDESSPRKSE